MTEPMRPHVRAQGSIAQRPVVLRNWLAAHRHHRRQYDEAPVSWSGPRLRMVHCFPCREVLFVSRVGFGSFDDVTAWDALAQQVAS